MQRNVRGRGIRAAVALAGVIGLLTSCESNSDGTAADEAGSAGSDPSMTSQSFDAEPKTEWTQELSAVPGAGGGQFLADSWRGKSSVFTTPDRVVVLSSNGFAGFSAADGAVVWTRESDVYYDGLECAASSTDDSLTCFDNREDLLYSLDINTGSQRWSIVDSARPQPERLAGGKLPRRSEEIVHAAADGIFVTYQVSNDQPRDPEDVFGSSTFVEKYDASSGEFRWKTDLTVDNDFSCGTSSLRVLDSRAFALGAMFDPATGDRLGENTECYQAVTGNTYVGYTPTRIPTGQFPAQNVTLFSKDGKPVADLPGTGLEIRKSPEDARVSILVGEQWYSAETGEAVTVAQPDNLGATDVSGALVFNRSNGEVATSSEADSLRTLGEGRIVGYNSKLLFVNDDESGLTAFDLQGGDKNPVWRIDNAEFTPGDYWAHLSGDGFVLISKSRVALVR